MPKWIVLEGSLAVLSAGLGSEGVGRSEMERVNRGPWKVPELRLLR